jgi:hypothetical protein
MTQPMPLTRTWQHRISGTRAALRHGGVTVALVSCSVVAIATIWGWLFGKPIDVAGPARTAVNRTALVGSFAQDCVGLWLTATQSQRSAMHRCWTLPDPLALPTTPAMVISAPAVAAVTLVTDYGNLQEWSVVVVVNERLYEAAAPVGAYYRIPVVYSDYGLRSPALPARVDGPGPGADATLAYPVTVAADSPAYTTASGFLTAYLAGAPGLDRYVTANSGLVASPGSYRSVTVTKMQAHDRVPAAASPIDGTTLQILVTVKAVTTQYAPTELVYPLTLRANAGRWSVAAIDQAPLIDPDADLTPVLPPTGAPS